MTNLTSAIAAAQAARAHFVRVATRACPDLAGLHPATRNGHLGHLLCFRSAEHAARRIGGSVAQQRAVRLAHRRYWRACAAERAAFDASVSAAQA